MQDPNQIPQEEAAKKEFKQKRKVVMVVFADAALEFAIMIFLPLFVFIEIGKKYNLMHNAWYLIFGLILALSISAISIGTRAIDFKKRLK